LRSLKRVVRERDGVPLVNELFDNDGRAAPYLDEDERRGMRDLLSGLFTLSRNWVGHNDVKAERVEAYGVVLLLHFILRRLADIKKRRKRPRKRGQQAILTRPVTPTVSSP
jgi:hypothetical protein